MIFYYSKLLRNRIAYSLKEASELYEITHYDCKKDQLSLQRIYDENAILLFPDPSTSKTITIKEALDTLHIMEEDEAALVRKEMEEGSHSISIKFQVEGKENFY
jgi:hypothetical protein